MVATLVDSRVKSGTLRLEDPDNPGTWFDASCVPSAVAITPGTDTTAGTDDLEVLCGSKFAGDTGGDNNTATLDLTVVSDFLEQGLVRFSWMHADRSVNFEWTPNNAKADSKWVGTVLVTPIQVGGEVNTRLTPSVSWDIETLMLPAAYGGTQWLGPAITGLTPPTGAAKEWTYTPGAAMKPQTVASIKSNANIGDNGTAKPIRDFKTGEFAQLSTGAHVSYKVAGGWVTGDAS